MDASVADCQSTHEWLQTPSDASMATEPGPGYIFGKLTVKLGSQMLRPLIYMEIVAKLWKVTWMVRCMHSMSFDEQTAYFERNPENIFRTLQDLLELSRCVDDQYRSELSD